MTEPRKTPRTDAAELPWVANTQVACYGPCVKSDFARALEIETQELAGLLEDVLEFIGEPPPPNCSCHISQPCNDCVDHAEAREIDSRINAALARHRAKQEAAR